MSRRKKRWSYSAGRRPFTVRVEEIDVGGNLYVGLWSRADKCYRYKSLRHRDRKQAMDYADQVAQRLREGATSVIEERITVFRLFQLYRKHRTPQKTPDSQKDDARCAEMFLSVLGPNREAAAISLSNWESFIAKRRSGAIDARGRTVPEKKRRSVGPRTVESNLRWLIAVYHWGMKWKLDNGQYLVKENPVRGFPLPKELNPVRPIATRDRYEAIRQVSDQITMDVYWGPKRKRIRCYLSEILDIVAGTGRRIGAVVHLTYADLRLDQGPHGSIRWPAATDKMRREWTVPISPIVRAAIDRILAERPGIGAAPLFPAPGEVTQALSYELAGDWLRKAEKLAGVPKLHRGLFHPYRRMWAMERKHLPAVDVAAAGGWANPRTLETVYQRADEATMVRVVMDTTELRSAPQG